MADDAKQTLISGYSVIVQLGDGPATEVKALCLEDSIKWSMSWDKKYTRLFPKINAITKKIPELMRKDENGKTLEVEDKDSVIAQRIEVNDELCDFLCTGHQAIMARDHLIEHGLPAERCKEATARQIVEAFRAVYQLENPPEMNQPLTTQTAPASV